MAGISGTSVAVITVGGLLAYAGFRGVTPIQALREVGSGKPSPVVGTPTSAPVAGVGAPAGVNSSGSGLALLGEMKRLGTGKSYSQLRRLGPDSYDCSGLTWKAGANVGLWGPGTKWFPQPFNTASFIVHTSEIGLKQRPAGVVKAGDILWWVGHMGVAESDTTFFSALSTRSGIRSLPISVITGKGRPRAFYFGA